MADQQTKQAWDKYHLERKGISQIREGEWRLLLARHHVRLTDEQIEKLSDMISVADFVVTTSEDQIQRIHGETIHDQTGLLLQLRRDERQRLESRALGQCDVYIDGARCSGRATVKRHCFIHYHPRDVPRHKRITQPPSPKSS